MTRLRLLACFFSLAAAGWWLSADLTPTAAADKTSGTGGLKFRTLYTSSHLPQEAQAVLEKAHGGFAIDRRPGKGETYFALPGAGIVQISADLKSTKMIPTPAELKDTNAHNTHLWTGADGTPYLSFPGNQAGKIFTTTLDGKLVNVLDTPDGSQDLGAPLATDYFRSARAFIPTDVEFLDGLLYITTGYSKLDYVLTAKVDGSGRASWHDLAFGGKGTEPGQFGTGHGITIKPGTKRIDVADRANSEIDRFTRFGFYLGTLNMPAGSLPCDIDFEGDWSVVGALRGPDHTEERGAPIYLLKDDKLVSTVMAKKDLGLELFTHIHNAAMREIDGKLYIIAQAWNPGDFAIFEQVK